MSLNRYEGGTTQHPLSRALDDAYYKGAFDGLLALVGATGLSIVGHRYVPFYRGFNWPAKGIFIASIALSTSVIQAERYMDQAYVQFQQTSSLNAQRKNTPHASNEQLNEIRAVEDVLHHSDSIDHSKLDLLTSKEALIFLTFGSFIGMGLWLSKRREPFTNAFCHMRLFSQGLALTAVVGPAAYFSIASKKKKKARP